MTLNVFNADIDGIPNMHTKYNMFKGKKTQHSVTFRSPSFW